MLNGASSLCTPNKENEHKKISPSYGQWQTSCEEEDNIYVKKVVFKK